MVSASAATKVSLAVFRVSMLLFVGVVLATQSAPAGKPQKSRIKPATVHFEDIARQVGLRTLNVYGNDTHKEFIIETTGNGAVIFDYDNDGWPDIYLPNGSTPEGFPSGNAPTAHLYHNNHDGTFTDVTAAAGLGRSGWGQAHVLATTTTMAISTYSSLIGAKAFYTAITATVPLAM